MLVFTWPPMTGQTVEDAIEQYRRDRDPRTFWAAKPGKGEDGQPHEVANVIGILPGTNPAMKDQSALLVALAGHLSRFLLRLFRLEDGARLFLDASGRRVIVAGVELDHRGLPFEPFPTLLCQADEVVKLTVPCAVCGRPCVVLVEVDDRLLCRRCLSGRTA